MTGYEVAEMLGLEAFHHETGDDGAAFFLEDGRILKVTSSAIEASACHGLLESDQTCANVPRVDLVRLFDESVVIPAGETVSGIAHECLMTRFVIVREGFDDPFDPPSFDFVPALRRAWANNSLDGLERIAAGSQGPVAKQILIGLRHVFDTTGVKVLDIRPSNIDQGASGEFGMRDLGRGECPAEILTARVARIPRLDESGLFPRY